MGQKTQNSDLKTTTADNRTSEEIADGKRGEKIDTARIRGINDRMNECMCVKQELEKDRVIIVGKMAGFIAELKASWAFADGKKRVKGRACERKWRGRRRGGVEPSACEVGRNGNS